MADKRKINLTRRLSIVKDKWYGVERFECENNNVVAVMAELKGSSWTPESIPGIITCNRIDTDFDFSGNKGRSHVIARFGPPDINTGRRPRKAKYAELLVYPAGTSQKQIVANDGQTIEGWDNKTQEILGQHRWKPNYNNTSPDNMHLVVVRTAVKTDEFNTGQNAIDARGAVNKNAMSLSWFNAPAETMLSLGVHISSDFDDDSLTGLDYRWLYDQHGWNEGKSTRSYIEVAAFKVLFNVEQNGEELTVSKKEGHKIPTSALMGGYTWAGNTVEKTEDVDLRPYRTQNFEAFQGYTWW